MGLAEAAMLVVPVDCQTGYDCSAETARAA